MSRVNGAWGVASALVPLGLFLPVFVSGCLWKFQVLSDVWIQEESPLRDVCVVGVGLVAAATIGWALRDQLTGRRALGMLVLAALCGVVCGPQLALVLNAVGDGRAETRVLVRQVEVISRSARWPGSEVRFQVVGGPEPRPTFRCRVPLWGEGREIRQREFCMRRGRLGVWWGEFCS
jgi:hypothetical protein